MKLPKSFERITKRTSIGERMITERQYRITVFAVISLILNLIFAFYNTFLGITSASFLFAATAVYYLLHSVMRFSAVMLRRHRDAEKQRGAVIFIGVMLIALSLVFQVMAAVSLKYKTAAVYGTIPMITIATFTFSKIITAIVSAVKTRRDSTGLIGAINMVRYSEIAVSLLTMQQSMLVSFGGEGEASALPLNIFTGTLVCIFILTLGVITLKRK